MISTLHIRAFPTICKEALLFAYVPARELTNVPLGVAYDAAMTLLWRLASLNRLQIPRGLPRLLTTQWLLSAGALPAFLSCDHWVDSIISLSCVKRMFKCPRGRQPLTWLTTSAPPDVHSSRRPSPECGWLGSLIHS